MKRLPRFTTPTRCLHHAQRAAEQLRRALRTCELYDEETRAALTALAGRLGVLVEEMAPQMRSLRVAAGNRRKREKAERRRMYAVVREDARARAERAAVPVLDAWRKGRAA